MVYNFKNIEKKWQKRWLEDRVFKAADKSKKPKYYQLETFPYPSAEGLHVGHPKGHIAEDIHARYIRMRGKEVLYTIGWDAFGLPTENYAIKVGKAPREVAEANVKNFKRQVQMFGLSYDWDREINTSSPEYYKWTQWLFIQLFKKGLAYKSKAKVNWCPSCMTVLANEQVINNSKVKNQNVKLQGKIQNEENVISRGVCERCGAEVEQRDMNQWFLKITDYAERLLKGLSKLDWPEATKKRQEDWIGKSEGALIKFPLVKVFGQADGKHFMEIFTTRPDTLFGATFLVVSPELAQKWIEVGWQANEEVTEYIKKSLTKKELDRLENQKDKTGVFSGIYAINPGNKEEIPVWVADYVLGSYGTGAIMAVPAHDQRDFEFAKKFELPVKEVVVPDFGKLLPNEKYVEGVVVIGYDQENGELLGLRWKNKATWLVGGGKEKGESFEEAARRELAEETGYKSVLTFIPLGSVYSHYYNDKKNINRRSFSHNFLAIINRSKQGSTNLETHEDFVPKWYNIKTLREEIRKVGGGIEHWLAILDRAEEAISAYEQKKTFEPPSYSGEGVLVNSGKFDGVDSEKACWEITKFVKGKKQVQYKIRDWSVSRQRYWGVPIPMINCKKCGVVPVLEKDLPVLLPDLKDYRPKGMPPLESSDAFIDVACPKCKGSARREAETLDTFVDSSWYYLRYTDPHNDRMPFDKLRVNRWLPVDLYIIGAEHTVLHLLYSRFITKFLHDEGYLKFEEPFSKLRHVGLIQGADGQKMSKSRGNVVNPDDLIEKFGADTLRVYEMFMGPFEQGQPWDAQGVLGAERFLARVWGFYSDANIQIHTNYTNEKLEKLLHKTIKKVGEDIETLNFNTAISALMILLNEMEKQNQLPVKSYESFVKLLYPFAPHMCEEIWHEILGKNTYLHTEGWPEYDKKKIVDEVFILVIQVNGKVRDNIEVDANIKESQAKELALKSNKVSKFIGGNEVEKTIFVPGKLINLVIKK